MKYKLILKAISETPIAMHPAKLESVVAFLQLQAAGEKLSSEQIAAAVGNQKRVISETPDKIGVIGLYGSIAMRANLVDNISGPGGTSTEQFGDAFSNMVNDPAIHTIVIDVDSPGGSVYGVPELAAKIFNARETKTVVAVVNAFAASAAYWLASAAEKIYITPSGEAGSIGVYLTHWDHSAALEAEGLRPTIINAGQYKVESNPYQPLNEDARKKLQGDVDYYYHMFVEAVAQGRNVATATVLEDFGQGRTLVAKDAVRVGMVDEIATLDEVLKKYGVRETAPGGASVLATKHDLFVTTGRI